VHHQVQKLFDFGLKAERFAGADFAHVLTSLMFCLLD
jgi:hypothetical protein